MRYNLLFSSIGGFMPKFILLVFVMLGFMFYELSGGSDFEPRSAAIKARLEKERPAPARNVRARTLPEKPRVEIASLVAAPAVVQSIVPRAESPAPEPAARIRPAPQSGSSEQVVLASLERGGETFGNVLNISPLADAPAAREPEPAAVAAAAPVRAAPEPRTDIRQITATRVNVRTGPGTDHDILTRANQGQQVEVLGDNGAGWLRLRLLPEDRVGWIAERLVSPAG